MRPIEEVLSLLSASRAPADVAETLRRLLRLPALWAAVREPGVLERCLEAGEGPLSPGTCLLAACGYSRFSDLQPPSIEWGRPAPDDDRATGAPDDESLRELLFRCARLVASKSEAAEFVAELSTNPAIWREALACVWPYVEAPQSWLQSLADLGGRGIALASFVLTCNSTLVEAAKSLSDVLTPESLPNAVSDLDGAGEHAMAVALAARAGPVVMADGFPDAMLAARLAHLKGEADVALLAAQKAWAAAQRSVAAAADALAEAADDDGDGVTSLEARRQAARANPTAMRRALLAVALAGQGDLDEAAEVLSGSSEDPMDRLARGILAALRGDAEAASENLTSGWTDLRDPARLPAAFARALLSAADASGQPDLALEMSAALAEADPAHAKLRRAHAERLMACGHAVAAVDEARLAFGLEPDSQDARRLLAKALQAADRPADALHVLGAEAGADSKSMAAAAAYALEAGQADQALAWSLRLLDQSPRSAEAKTLHARALALGGASVDAVRELETLTEESPEDEQVWLALADVHLHTGEMSRAGEVLTRASQAVPDSPALLMALGRWHAAQSRWTEAEPLMRKACASADSPALWHFDHAMALEALGWQEQSADAYERCARSQPGHWPARLALSMSLEGRGRLEEAWHWLEGLPADAPASAHYAAGRLGLLRGTGVAEAREAAGHLLRARSLGETGAELDWWLGQAFETSRDFARAAESYDRTAVEAESGSELQRRAWMAKGRVSLEDEQPAAAVAAFQQLRELDPSDVAARVWLSRACQAVGLGAEALAEARAASEMDPASPAAAARWAETAHRFGQAEEAVAAAKKRAVLSPGDGAAWLALGDLLLGMGSADEAREAAARAVATGRKDASILRQSADLLARLDDVPAAERLLESLVRLHPADAGGWTSLAEFYERSGRFDKASEAWLRASEIESPTREPVRRAAKALAKAGQGDQALSVLRTARAAHPGDPYLALELANVLLERGQKDEAVSVLHMIGNEPELSPLERGHLGLLLSRAGEGESGLASTRGAVEGDPESAWLWTVHAEVNLRLGLPAEALPALDRALRLPDRSLTAFALLVPAHLARGDAASAWDGLRAAASEPPSTIDEVHSLALAHLRLGEWQAALNTIDDYGAHGDATAAAETCETLLRMCDAQWLYGETGGADRHSPAGSREGLLARVREFLDGPLADSSAPRYRLIRARWAQGANGDEQSLIELQAACEAAGSPPPALEGLTIALLRADRPKDAFAVVQGLPSNSLEGFWRPLLAGLCHRSLGNLDRARQAFEAAGLDPSLFPLARALTAMIEDPSTERAVVLPALNDAVAAWPNEPAWHLMLANLYLDQEELDAALPHLQHAADLDPENSDAWLALARALREAGHPNEAQQAYEQVVRLLPGLGQVWKEAGALALARSDYERAATWFARAQALAPSDVEALTGAARADLGLGRLAAARTKAQTALEQRADSSAALECLAQVLALEGDVEQALSMLERAASSSESPAAIAATRARLLTEHGRADQAVTDLQRILEETSDETLWAALADALASIGRFDEALKAGSEAARMAPRSALHRIRLGRISRQAGYLDRALDELAQAEALASSAELAMEQGQVHEERREFDRALQAYQHAVELDPGLEQAYLRAGLVYRSLKAYPQAARMFKRAVELAPEDASALHQLAAVHALQLVHGGFHPSAVTT